MGGVFIVTSRNRNAFRVTGPLWGESIRGIPSQRVGNTDFDVFFDVSISNSWINRRVAGDLGRHDTLCDVIEMCCGLASDNFTHIRITLLVLGPGTSETTLKNMGKYILWSYRKTSNISRTLVGNIIVDNSDAVGALPVGAAPTTSSFST